MANNRMWLIHKPTQLGVMLGKRMSSGWYDAPEAEHLERFFQYLEDNPAGSQDDFTLAMEDCGESDCFDGWQYLGDECMVHGFRKFEFTGEGA